MSPFAALGTDQLLIRYEAAASAHGEARLMGAVGDANDHAADLWGISAELRGRQEERLLLALLNSPNPWVRFQAALDALSIAPVEGERALEELAGYLDDLTQLGPSAMLALLREGRLPTPSPPSAT